MQFFVPFPVVVDGAWYKVDKHNPGVWVSTWDAEGGIMKLLSHESTKSEGE
jgi:hypothetical protein